MRLRNVSIVFRKELVDVLRDRRTLISMIVIPVVVFPIMMLALPKVMVAQVTKEKDRAAKVAVIGSGSLSDRLKENKNLEIVQVDDFVKAIREKQIDVAVELPKDFDDAIKSKRTCAVALYRDSAEMSSNIAEQKVWLALQFYMGAIIKDRLERVNVDLSLLQPFKVEKKDVASEAKKQGALIATVLPYILIILCLTGAMYVAIDLTAGEKERGTLETLLVSPAARMELVVGKLAMAFLASVVTASLAMTSMGITFAAFGGGLAMPGVEDAPKFQFSVPVSSIFLMLVVLLPIAATFSSLLICVALFARSYKEAMTYISPSMIVAILPAMISVLPGVRPSPAFALIPIANVSLGMSEILKGQYDWLYLAITFGSSIVLSALSVLLATRLFMRESVLFRTT